MVCKGEGFEMQRALGKDFMEGKGGRPSKGENKGGKWGISVRNGAL